MTSTAHAASWPDVAVESELQIALEWLSGKGAVGEGRAFAPEAHLLRQDASKMLAEAFFDDPYIQAFAGSYYADTDPGAWYAQYIGAGQQSGLWDSWIERGNFLPGRIITRGQFAQALVSAIRRGSPAGLQGQPLAPDMQDPLMPAYAAFAALLSLNAADRDAAGNLRPDAPVSRAEAAVMIFRAGQAIAGNRTETLRKHLETLRTQTTPYAATEAALVASVIDPSQQHSPLSMGSYLAGTRSFLAPFLEIFRKGVFRIEVSEVHNSVSSARSVNSAQQ